MRSKTSKTMAAIAGAGALTLTLAACGGNGGGGAGAGGETGEPGSQQGETVLRVAFNQNIEHPQAQALLQASDEIYESTDGAYSLQLFTDETLGDQNSTIEQMQTGALDFTIVASPLLESFEPQMAVVNLPYLYTSPEQQVEVLNDPEITGDLYALLEEDGIKVLEAYHAGVRNIYTTDAPVESPEDLAGLKIRIIPSDTNQQMMSLMGGVGTPMAAGEIYTALQSGVVDGAENNEITYNDQSHVETAKYYSRTEHLMLPDYLLASNDVWNGLDAETQEAFMTAFDTSVQTEFDLWAEDTERATNEAVEQGAEIIEVDVEPFREAVLPLHEQIAGDGIPKAVYDAIMASGE